MPTVSVIVVSFNTRDLLAQCLAALEPERADLEVIVVDNASSDGSAKLVEERFPRTVLIANPHNLGYARANNQALAIARGNYLLLLNSDAIVRPGCIDALQRALERQPELGVIGPALFNPDGSRQPSWGRFPSLATELAFQTYFFRLAPVPYPIGTRVHPLMRPWYSRARRVDWVTGAALMLRREVYLRVGGVPVSSFMYGEDVELCLLARRGGFLCGYEPAAQAVHYLGASSRKDFARWIQHYTRGSLGYYERYTKPRERALAAAAIVAGSCLRAGLWSAVGLTVPQRRSEARARVQGYRDAATLGWVAIRSFLTNAR